MSKLNVFGAIVLFVLALCSCSQKSKLESMAKVQMEKTFIEMAKNPESVKLSNSETVYADDSLCIIHVDFIAKNGLGNEVKDRCEYIFILSNGKYYESYQEIAKEEDGVFATEDNYNKEKKGTIYETLDYESRKVISYEILLFASIVDYQHFTKLSSSLNLKKYP